MSSVQFFETPGFGAHALENLHYHQVVRVSAEADRVEISGQGGVDDDLNIPESLEEEIRQAFVNVERVLAAAGATWPDVIHVNSYHVLGEDKSFEPHNAVMIDEFRKRMPDRAPIWTETAVVALGLPPMRIEIRVTAVVEAE